MTGIGAIVVPARVRYTSVPQWQQLANVSFAHRRWPFRECFKVLNAHFGARLNRPNRIGTSLIFLPWSYQMTIWGRIGKWVEICLGPSERARHAIDTHLQTNWKLGGVTIAAWSAALCTYKELPALVKWSRSSSLLALGGRRGGILEGCSRNLAAGVTAQIIDSSHAVLSRGRRRRAPTDAVADAKGRVLAVC